MIAPEVLAEQRRHETHCRHCGKRTTDQSGTCAQCRRLGVVSFEKYPTSHLLMFLDRIRKELERRAEEANAAVEMAKRQTAGDQS